MSPALRTILISIALAFVAGLGGVWIGKTILADPPKANFHEQIHRELALSADQNRKIESLESEYATKRRALEAEMQAANADLAAAIRAEQGYGPRVTAAVERFHMAMGNLQKESISHVFAMRAVLSPSQKARFDIIVASALTDPQ